MKCYISFGSNMGDRAATIAAALVRLESSEKIHIVRVSSLYETPPWGVTEQPAFLNGVAELDTEFSPLELLHFCQEVELALGRVRHEHWGPRTIDLDLLYIPGVISVSEELKLPHPYMLERAFVLVPLAEIAGDLMLEGKTVKDRAEALPDAGEVMCRRRITAAAFSGFRSFK